MEPPDFRALFESVPGLYLALRPDSPRFTIVAASDAYCRASMTERARIVGRSVFEIFPDNPSDPRASGARRLRASLERVLATRAADAIAVYRYDIARPDGEFEERWWSPFNAPVIGERGEVRYIVHRVEDVTEFVRAQQATVMFPGGTERELRESELRMRMLLASIRDYAVFMLDAAGHIASWNPGAQQLNGYTAGEIIGRHFSVFYPPEDVRAGKCEYELAMAVATGRFEDEGWRVRKDGSRFWSNVVISAVRDEQHRVVGFSKVTRDLTERKRAEEERLRLAQVQEALRVRDEFLSIAAHELKTPLTSLQLQIGGVQRSLTQPSMSREKLVSRISVVAKQVERLASLVEELLDVSRATAGRLKLDLQELDLADVVRDVIERHREDLRAARCELRVDVRGPIVGVWDRSRLDQIATNFLMNAMKYGQGAPIEIYAREDGDRATLAVRDHGIGIELADQERIFERFGRAAPAEHYGGLGLGLWIVKVLVDAMGGRVSVESRKGEGATFTVELPRGPRSDDRVAADETGVPKLS